MRRRYVIAGAIMLCTMQLYALNPLCNGVCLECKTFYPLIEATAQELKTDYLSAENDLSNRYNSKIMPLLEDRKTLLRQYDELMAELEALNKLTAIKVKELVKEKEKEHTK